MHPSPMSQPTNARLGFLPKLPQSPVRLDFRGLQIRDLDARIVQDFLISAYKVEEATHLGPAHTDNCNSACLLPPVSK